MAGLESNYGPTTINCFRVSRAVSPGILAFSIEQIRKFLQQIDPDNENGELHYALEWLFHDWIGRAKHQLDLLQDIDLSQYCIGYVEFLMRKYERVLDLRPRIYKCLAQDLLQRALEPQKSRNEGTGLVVIMDQDQCFWHSPEQPCEDSDDSPALSKLGTISENIEDMQDYALCASYRGFALTGGNGSKLCVQYNICKNRWEELVCLLSQRKFHSAFYVSNYRTTSAKMFVFGGVVDRSKEPMRSVESLEIYDTEWIEEPAMPRAVIGASVAQVKNTIYVMAPEVLQCLDLKTDTWSEVPNCAERLYADGSCSMSMASAQDMLYIVKGTTFSSYDPMNGEWTELEPHKLHAVCGPLVYHQHRLYILGAEDDDSVMEYNCDTKKWDPSDFKLPSPMNTTNIKSIQATTVCLPN